MALIQKKPQLQSSLDQTGPTCLSGDMDLLLCILLVLVTSRTIPFNFPSEVSAGQQLSLMRTKYGTAIHLSQPGPMGFP